MKDNTARKISSAGGIFITLSGILNLVLGVQIGALHYYPYPGGKMGHVGITAGLTAIAIGLVMFFALPRLSEVWRVAKPAGLVYVGIGTVWVMVARFRGQGER